MKNNNENTYMKMKVIQYGSKKNITMINLSNKVYDKIDINQNKYFSYCRKEKNIF